MRKNYQRTEYDDYIDESWEENGKFITQNTTKPKSMEEEINFSKIIRLIKSYRKFLFVILLIMIVALWFYWFQIRPSQIYSECNEVAKRVVSSRYDIVYKQCLRERGLEK